MTEPLAGDRPAYRLYRWLWTGLDWLFPPRCGGCGKSGTRWCSVCQSKTQIIKSPVCDSCGEKLAAPGQCLACQRHPPQYTALRSYAYFGGPLRQALHRLKYLGDVALGDILAQPMASLLADLSWSLDLVVPVPMSSRRQHDRGYNQAALLARPLALAYGLSYQPRAMIKLRETPSQVGLSVNQRQDNVHRAFGAEARWVAGKRVLVIDDVTTSGATLQSCAAALRAAAADQVYCLTLARAASHSI
jgi:competence protein ComFC